MCGSMVDIQSAAAEIRRGIKKEKSQGKNIMSASATQGGHKNNNAVAHGPINDSALSFLSGLGRRIADVSGETREGSFFSSG